MRFFALLLRVTTFGGGVRMTANIGGCEWPADGEDGDTTMPAVGHQRVRVYLLDDHAAVRRMVADLAESTGKFEVVGRGGFVADGHRHLCGERLDPGGAARPREQLTAIAEE